MRCPACGGATPEDKPFCANCGAGLSTACANCGAALLIGKPFCADCGTPVAASMAAPRLSAAGDDDPPTSERRLCSVLFVDLVGFTPLAERADPEEVRELLTRYFDRAQAIVANYGGTVEKFIGDAVMAVWGAPVANEDDAERSVRAALDVVAAVADLGRETGHTTLAARAGIVTGEAAVTVGKVAEGMVLGDTVNSASRVQGAAAPGTVYVDEATWRSSSDAIAYVSVGDLVLKGKEDVVAAYRALRVVAQRKGLGRTERLEPPFVGRADELRLVKDLLHATVREQRARLVSVTGVPGIGKSRLSWEFLKYVDGLAETVYWHQGRSASYGEGVTFGALGDMVRMRAGINEAEDAESSRAKLAACVAEYVADDEERQWIEPRLTHLLGLADAAGKDREELFSAWRTFFERIAEHGLTVLVFEDLQWADPGLIDFIESILEWSRSHPIMVVTLSRPELRDLRPEWGAGQRSFTSLHLDPLSDDDMRTLLAGFVSGLPDEVAEKVRERAEGVPLYAVETVRMLVDRGVLVADGDAYRVVGELPELEMPETLHALVASRLDALHGDQRSLLQDAAVLGTTFLPETLAVVHGTDRSALDGPLRDLVRKEFLRVDSDPRSPERGQYGFVQGVIAEVALSMLARRDRSAKHLVAARHYESLDDEELTAVVAAHYASAHRAAPEGADADEIAASASEWLTRAGERALSLGSPDQALDLFDQALEVTPAGPAHAALLERAAEAAGRAVKLDRSLSLIEAAVTEHEAAGDRDAVGRATAGLAQALLRSRRYQEGYTVSSRAYEALGEDASLEVRTRLAAAAASHLCQTSPRTEAALNPFQWSEIALAHAEALGDVSLLIDSLRSRSLMLYNVGRHREAVMLARGTFALATEAGELREQALALQAVSLYTLPDDPHESVDSAIGAAEIARRGGHRQMEILGFLNATETSIMLGRLAEARVMLTQVSPLFVEEESRQWSDSLWAILDALGGDLASAKARIAAYPSLDEVEFLAQKTTFLCVSSIVSLAAGDLVEAQAEAAAAVRLDPMGINSASAVTLWARASIWRRDVEAVREALAAARPLRGRWMAAMVLTVEAGLAALEGDRDGAADRYAAAIERWRAIDCTFDMALAELDLVLTLGPDDPAAVVGKEAADVFTQVGAVQYLARLDAEGAVE